IVESLLPIAQDPHSREGRDLLGLSANDRVAVTPFRVLAGDDASCLNLYAPRTPTLLGAKSQFIEAGRFAFQSSLATTAAERGNPWVLLERDDAEGSIPVVADANSMTYVLHRKLGDEIVINHGAQPVRLRLVAALADSIFQSELLMSEAHF